MIILRNLFILLTVIFSSAFAEDQFFVKTLALNSSDKPSLQRGAQLYFNYCSQCHSLSYERYRRVASAIGVENQQHQVYVDLVQKSMLFDPTGDIDRPIMARMTAVDAKKKFAVIPPDLTNITLVRSPAWVYNFLRGFYRDDSRLTGFNNLILPNCAMPNVLLSLRGETQAVWVGQRFSHLMTTQSGRLRPLAFDHAIYDLVNFLGVVANPNGMMQFWLGIACVVFLSILFIMLYFFYKTLSQNKD